MSALHVVCETQLRGYFSVPFSV